LLSEPHLSKTSDYPKQNFTTCIFIKYCRVLIISLARGIKLHHISTFIAHNCHIMSLFSSIRINSHFLLENNTVTMHNQFKSHYNIIMKLSQYETLCKVINKFLNYHCQYCFLYSPIVILFAGNRRTF
jgi:hypothetical protein